MQKETPSEPETGTLGDRIPKSRAERRREDTRRRLLKATYEIIAKRGMEGLVIQDITQAADVGYGSFYNHFTSKEAAVAAVIDASRSFAHEIYRRARERASDKAEAFAMELIACLSLSKSDPTWGWFLVRTVLSGEGNRSGIDADLRRGLGECAKTGVLNQDLEIAYEITAGLLLIGTLKLLRGDLPDDYPARLVETILKQLGVREDKITAILSKPLPSLQHTPFLEAAA